MALMGTEITELHFLYCANSFIFLFLEISQREGGYQWISEYECDILIILGSTILAFSTLLALAPAIPKWRGLVFVCCVRYAYT